MNELLKKVKDLENRYLGKKTEYHFLILESETDLEKKVAELETGLEIENKIIYLQVVNLCNSENVSQSM
ncbi:hypothetical protein LCGC14_0432900 [marine sediment metagenome]|uniref:Uncharacterized protein n=1 Tax=marine sediment metagenome TaxID=412755 RepID=A0A0F9SMN7_9ZZZZ